MKVLGWLKAPLGQVKSNWALVTRGGDLDVDYEFYRQ